MDDCTAAAPPPPPPPTSTGLKLLGTWSSSYTLRVRLALKLKGLPFDYAEEDLSDKSPSLLLHNPVYKKVPVLLHHGRPLLESSIILHYLDDAWPDTLPILPSDPYDRAAARFWCHFVDDKLGPSLGDVFRLDGEEQKAAVEAVHQNLQLLETELREGHFKGRSFFGGDQIGLLDIVLGCGSFWLSIFEEVAAVKVVEPDSFPLFSAWLQRFESLEEVKDTIPPLDKLLDYAKPLRLMLLGISAPATVPADAGDQAADKDTSAAVILPAAAAEAM